MDSLEYVDHYKIKIFQTWNMHKLATIKFNQITNLIIIWILKLILEWNHLQWLCVTVPNPLASLSKIIETPLQIFKFNYENLSNSIIELIL
jgi:hypothetical protein